MPPDGKYALGLRGFPTPNDVPDDGGYILFRLPSENEWAGLILGAVLQLGYSYNWYQWGDMTPDEASEAFRLIITQAPYNLLSGIEIPTPFWDDETDLDDEATPELQTWYGEVTDPEAPADELTFVENIGIWTIAGFLAYSGQIGGAIYFTTIAPRFVLAWRRGDVGEIIRIVVDAADYGTIDTSTYAEGDIIEMDIVGDPELETHSFYVIKAS